MEKYSPALNPQASAINPMMGGPIKKPKYPILDAIEIPTLASTLSRLPAVVKMIGIIVETPKPTKKKPINVV